MIVKYKVSDFAKDLNLSTKKVLDELTAMGSTGKKNSSNLEENELNYLLEKFSKAGSVKDLDEFLNSAKAPKEEPKAAEKKADKKADKKPETPKAEKKPEQPAAKKAEPAQQNKNNNKHNDKKPEQHKKREEKTVSLSELARETGAAAENAVDHVADAAAQHQHGGAEPQRVPDDLFYHQIHHGGQQHAGGTAVEDTLQRQRIAGGKIRQDGGALMDKGRVHQRRQQRTYSLPHLITGESICSAAKKEHACRRVLFL